VTIENIEKTAYHDASIKNHREKDRPAEKFFLTNSSYHPNGFALKTV
jgi:hypothetical protein